MAGIEVIRSAFRCFSCCIMNLNLDYFNIRLVHFHVHLTFFHVSRRSGFSPDSENEARLNVFRIEWWTQFSILAVDHK